MGGNGGSYDGKLTFLHVVPGFTCETKKAPKAILRRDQGIWKLTENQTAKCEAILDQIVTDVQYKEGSSFLNYKGNDFYKENNSPADSGGLINFVDETLVRASADPNSADASPGDGICANAAGVCSLKAALDEANTQNDKSHVIRLEPGTYNINFTILMTSQSFAGLYGDDPSTTIIRGGHPVQGMMVSGPNLSFSGTRTLQNVSMNNGNNTAAFSGSGLSVLASIHVKNCIFENHNSPFNAVIYSGVSGNHLLVEKTRIRNNNRTGIQIFGPESVTVVDSEIMNNGAFGLWVDNGSWNIQVLRTSVVGNGMDGIRLHKCYTNCRVENSTIANNVGHGIVIESPPNSFVTDDLIIRNSTLVNNGSVASGRNLYVDMNMNTPGHVLRLENTILSSAHPVCSAPSVVNYGIETYNVISSDAGCATGGTPVTVGSANLGPLQYNPGGTGQTFVPLIGSPAINSGSNALCSPIDQLGKPRPGVSSPTCDIGAVEVQ